MSVREALARVRTYPDAEALLAQEGEFHILLRTILDWGQGERKSTKSVVKEFAQLLSATGHVGESEVSLYSRGVEMLSFAAACAPLLDPDRLLRLVKVAGKPGRSYRGVEDPAALSEKLQRVLGHFAPERRLELLVSLWETAHADEWWDQLRPRKLNDPQDEAGEDQATPAVYRQNQEVWTWDGTLSLPERASTVNWWWDDDNLRSLTRGLQAHKKPFFEQMRDAAAKVDVFGMIREVRKEAAAEPYRYYGDVDLEPFLVALQADANPRFWTEFAKAFGRSEWADNARDNVYSGTIALSVWLFPFLGEKTVKEMFSRFDCESLLEYDYAPRGALIEWLVKEASPALRDKVYEVMESSYQSTDDLLAAGFVSEETFRAKWAKWSALERLEVISSPYLSLSEVRSTVLKAVKNSPRNRDALHALGSILHELPMAEVLSYRKDFKAQQRMGVLAGIKGSSVFLDAEMDQTILSAALRQCVAAGNDEGFLLLAKHVDSWGAADAAVEGFNRSELVKAVSVEEMDRILSLVDAPEGTARRMLRIEGLSVEKYRVLAANYLGGNVEAGVVTNLVAAGVFTRAELASITSSRSRSSQALRALDPNLAPAERPADTIVQLVDGLLKLDNPEEGKDPRPNSWKDLLPREGFTPYKIPAKVLKIHGQKIAGDREVKICRNDAELHKNAQEMGNCTFSYAGNCKTGATIIGSVVDDGKVYNFSVVKRNGRYHLSQVEGRFNRGGVSRELYNALQEMASSLPCSK